jgi:hypothetical protein
MEEFLHQSRDVVYPSIYKVSTIQSGAGFLPSTVCLNTNEWVVAGGYSVLPN